ncbi:zf-HC2 domain-containing protein [Actinomycetospora chiangmaiensis]|uniref:zf-HC2 domain-containing protein n=1 Tax=Actinomycetospora chiangmaiensis TaxID=402650 RepID=UPI00035EB59D|nr:zf-HC2 domain-containing protein [Actinomycetospora chiangmaiensis]
MIGRAPGAPWSRWSDSGHLTLDAVVAFVDGELGEAAAGRAAAHVDHCPSCAAEVAAQRQARRRLRAADCPGVPSSLLASLRNIPDDAELPEAPAGLGIDAQGRFVVPAEAPPARHGRRGGRGPRSRRRVLPAVVASGLVAGAAAVAGPVLAAGAVSPAPTPGRAPEVGASLTAAAPAVGDRGNVVVGAVVQDAAARAATTTPTTPPMAPPDATRARPSS